MAPKNRIIIDTDPGVDDAIAMLLALSASPEELEVVMISVTYGNVQRESCLRNVVALFHVLDKEMDWRKARGKGGYDALETYKPIVAVGADHPLEEESLMADYFHGADGLHGVHESHPHLTPEDTWKELFDCSAAAERAEAPSFLRYFTPSKEPSHKEMLRILAKEAANTITIVAVGPLTNVALAASEDPETFLRVKEVVVMGGAVHVEGNITPCGEFNCYADAVAAARVYALTSPDPESTMPLRASHSLPQYPAALSRQLNLTLFPLDITRSHELRRGYFTKAIKEMLATESPLAQWTSHFMNKTFDHIDRMVRDGSDAGLSLHDPLCIWYMLSRDDPAWKPVPELEDIRVETAGQWTRGMHVVDRRNRAKAVASELTAEVANPADPQAMMTVNEVPGDAFGWLSMKKGNRIKRMVKSPGEAVFAQELMKRIFG